MANGHGGKRPGAGRKAQPKAPTIPATPKRKSRALAMALDIIRQSHALANRQRRDPKLNPFQLPAFPPAAVPQEKKLQMAMDNSMTWAGTAWAASTIEGTADAGLLFPGYAFLSLLAQRQEYRLVSETIADDATRRWIDFEVTGEKRQGEKEAEERQRQSRIAQQQQPIGDEAPMMTPPPAGGAGGGRTFEDPDPDERGKRIDRAGKADKVKAIKDEMLRLEARDRYYCVSRDDGFFGRSHLYMNFGTDIDGDAPDELRTPIGDGRDATSRGKVNKGRPLQSLRVIEPVWTYPTTYNAVNPLREDWYSPQVWYVLGKEIHRSRLPTFIGHPVPDLLKPAYSFGGISMSQLVKPYVDIWLTTRSSVGQLIHSFSVMVLLTDMQTILQPTGDEGDEGFPVPNVGGLLARVAEFNALRDNQNTFVLNKDTEDFKNVSASLAGLHELQAQSLEHIASCSRIPLVKLTGISPSGLNASSEGEIRAYYDTIAAYQNRFFRPNLTKLINFVQLSLFDEIDPEITFEFEPLWEMSEVERAELQQKEAETSKTYVDMGAIGNDEVRQVIIDDPKLPFADLNPEDTPDLRSEEEMGMVPEGGGRAVEGLLEAGPGAGPGPAEAQPEGGEQQRRPAQAGGKDPAFQDSAPGGGAAVLPFLETGEDAKVSKAEADYVPSIEDVTEQCSQCSMFRRVVQTFDGNRCDLVDGDISALGHCRHFQRLSPEGQRDNPDAIFHGSGTGDEEPYWTEGSNVGPRPIGKTVHDAAFDAQWEEGKHKRGQPGNAGQFGSGGGGAQQQQKPQQTQQPQRSAGGAQPAQQIGQRPARKMRSENERAFGRHIAEQIEKLTPAQKEKHAGHVKKTREFFSGDGSRKATAKAVSEFAARHVTGIAQHHLTTAVMMPVVHHVVEQAVEMIGLGSIPGMTLGATATAAYSVHKLMEHFDLSLLGGVELIRDVVKGVIGLLRGTADVAKQVAKLENEHGVTARDAEDDPILTALLKLLVALDEMEDGEGDGEEPESVPAPKKDGHGQAGDASMPMTLYINRPLLNAADLIAWARASGIEKTISPGDMHVTIAFSKTPVDWAKVGDSPDQVAVKDRGVRSVEALGAEGAVVLRFESGRLAKRWKQIKDDAGASWDWPGYKPHVTITYDAGGVDVSKVEPYRGELVFGPERVAQIDEGWAAKAKDSLVATDEAPFEESQHPRDDGGKFATTSAGTKSIPRLSAKLTPTEKAHLSQYSGDDFLRLNNELRAGESGGEAAKRLDTAIAKSTLPAGTRLFRGLSKDALKTLIGGDEIKVGQVLSDKAFLSTSTDPYIGNYIGGVQLDIHIGEDQVGLDMEGINSNKHEKEVLLPRNTKLKIVGLRAPKTIGAPIVVRVETVNTVSKDDTAEADDAFSAAEHPRGQPKNAGQFASSPGGGSTGGKSGEASGAHAPGVKASGLPKTDALKAEWSKSAPDTLEKLAAAAPVAQQKLAAACDEIGAVVGTKFVNPGAKKPDRIADKIKRGKPPARITDAARGGFDVESPDQADAIIGELGKRFEVADEGWQRTPAGYFDRKVMVRFDDGLVGEVQFWPPGMLETKEKKGHALYEAWQRAMPGPEKAKLLGAQVALYGMIAAALPQAWHAVNFAPAT